jgi:CheY-like chemotaxis protein
MVNHRLLSSSDHRRKMKPTIVESCRGVARGHHHFIDSLHLPSLPWANQPSLNVLLLPMEQAHQVAMARKHILVVDDELEVGALIKTIGQANGYDVEVTGDGESFKSSFLAREPDLVVMDIAIPECDGLELMKFLAKHHCKVPIVVMSGGGDYYLNIGKSFAQRHRLKVIQVLEKPFRVKDLVSILESAES